MRGGRETGSVINERRIWIEMRHGTEKEIEMKEEKWENGDKNGI